MVMESVPGSSSDSGVSHPASLGCSELGHEHLHQHLWGVGRATDNLSTGPGPGRCSERLAEWEGREERLQEEEKVSIRQQDRAASSS